MGQEVLNMDEAKQAAYRGDVSGMIRLAWHYLQQEEFESDLAESWAIQAAYSGSEQGNAEARKIYMTLAFADAKLGEYEESYVHWRKVTGFASKSKADRGSREREQATSDSMEGIFGAAYACYMMNRYEAALELLEPYESWWVDSGCSGALYGHLLWILCKYEQAEENDNLGVLKPGEFDEFLQKHLKNYEFLDEKWETFQKQQKREDKARILMLATISYSSYLRIFKKDLAKAYSVLDRTEQIMEFDGFKELITKKKSRYKKNLFGRYVYHED